MGANTIIIICIIIIIFSSTTRPWPCVHGSDIKENDSLDNYLYQYALNNIQNPHTGTVYNVPLPANLSGAELSFIRLRTRSLLRNGANHTPYFTLPPGTIPVPYTKRLDIVYQNLGNWSSSYYYVPYHTLVTPVTGFLAYDSNVSSTNYGPLDFILFWKDPIVARFPNLSKSGNEARCVRFDADGSTEFSNVTEGNSCAVSKQGHFAVVVPKRQYKERANTRVIEVVGSVVGLLALVMIVVGGVVGYDKWVRKRRMAKMDGLSEVNVALDTIWIGRSRMPYAAAAGRTFPVIQNRYVR
ncbi:Protein of unknown function (DUF1191 [Striga hermonthica]|uniref:Uncharacterized protein n=1 Tax=Striga hermonthica TaxID=68872 RepID=A0A9N7RI95_STRHE|nr:Protein of unknown function (DUF1191 [Striga hermonthica]